MPEFTNPFIGMIPGRKMTAGELERALRLDLAAEEEAIHIYQAQADATDNELARKVLLDIANEERVHAGEFQRLLNILCEDEQALMEEGAQEVDEIAQESDQGPSSTETESSAPATESSIHPIPRVGDLKQ